jgi:predicted nuclease of predicted toxin-antitoxin system
MKFKLDENIPVEASALLREAGHESLTVLDQNMGGEEDERIIHACRHERRVLVTLDLDFADIKTYPPSEHQGIIVLRIKRQSRAIVLEAIKRLIPLLHTEPMEKRLWIVEENKIRVRE